MRCVRAHPPAPGSGAYCNDNGGSGPCVLLGNCEQTLAATVATVRPDGVMTPAIGVSQLIVASWSPSGKKPLNVALSDLFPTLMIENEMAIKAVLDAPTRLFSALFATAPNDGITSSEKCEGYLVARAYTKERAAILRRDAAILTI